MSARSPLVVLAPQAERDFAFILVYTQRMWGGEQRAGYRATIAQALRSLREHPQTGRPRDDLFPGCRSMQVEQHIIYYYQPDATEIVVLRILHHRQDASAEVQEPPS
jgi:toxin ParE1/3/4